MIDSRHTFSPNRYVSSNQSTQTESEMSQAGSIVQSWTTPTCSFMCNRRRREAQLVNLNCDYLFNKSRRCCSPLLSCSCVVPQVHNPIGGHCLLIESAVCGQFCFAHAISDLSSNTLPTSPLCKQNCSAPYPSLVSLWYSNCSYAKLRASDLPTGLISRDS